MGRMRRMREAEMRRCGDGGMRNGTLLSGISADPSTSLAMTALSSRASEASRGIRTSRFLIASFAHFRTSAVAAVLLAASTACNFAPRHVQPALPTPPAYDPSLNVADGREPRAPEIGWREFFRDPRLNALIATALDYNRDLRVAVGRIDVARGQYRIRGADR